MLVLKKLFIFLKNAVPIQPIEGTSEKLKQNKNSKKKIEGNSNVVNNLS
jgi:hypothetical protein